ncbi:hypothetical protein QCA50_019288 [Cerrena zonata]|uniref:F-box domain-containing protein n=1 Tax=Cerrena zonata TaxID=2478898 RepID=A0AAW0FBJ4_9APHY
MDSISRINELENELDDSLRSTLGRIQDEEKLNDLIIEQQKIVEDLERRIVKHRRIIATIQTRRNFLVPRIHSVWPPEVLAEVFLNLVYEYFNCEEMYHGPYSWLKATHVCRYWREVIMSHPILFSYINYPVRDSQHLEEAIRLSASTPLTIRIGGIGESCLDLWKTVSPLLSRAKSLEIPTPPNHFVWPLCPNTICLKWRVDTSIVNKPSQKTVIDVLRNMPKLRVLTSHLGTLGPVWIRLPIPSTLTTLRVDHSGTSCGFSLEELGVCLSTLKALVVLDFQGLDPSSYSSWSLASPSRLPPETLPLLTILRLRGTLRAVVGFLNLPLSAVSVDVYITSSVRTSENEDLASLSRAMRAVMQSKSSNSPGPHIMTCSSSLHRLNPYVMAADICGMSDGELHDQEIPVFRVHFSHYEYDYKTQLTSFAEAHNNLIYEFRTMISSAQRLIVVEDISMPAYADLIWPALILHLPNIRSIQMVLNGQWTMESDETSVFAMAKLLPTILDFHHLTELDIVWKTDLKPKKPLLLLLDNLTKSLSIRQAPTPKLETLAIDRNLLALVSEDTVERLSSLVGRVIQK